ncbi:NAD(P)-dependent oxidoreductase [Amylibacter sp.]|nr:NAD(P)-dependent oxidoreductase [Amylibacter sp.]
MTVLITGATGFVGINVFKWMQDNTDFELLGCGRKLIKNNNYVKCDLTNLKKLDAIFKQYDISAIIHIAAQLSDFSCARQKYENIVMAQNIKYCMRKYSTKTIINISSIPIIGNISYVPIDELHPIKPSTAYHQAKWEIEKLFTQLTYGSIKVYNVRIPSPLGPGLPQDSFFNVVLNNALQNKRINIFASPGVKQNFVDIRDLCNLLKEILYYKPPAGTYLFGSEKAISYYDAALLVRKYLNSSSEIKINKQTDRSDNKLVQWDIDISKVNRKIGITPRYTLMQTIDWILQSETSDSF